MRRGKRARIVRIPRRRADDLLLRCIRTSFRLLRVFPDSLSAVCAELLFLTPPPHRRTRREHRTLSQGTFRTVDSGGCRLATWRWGEGPPVLLVHGWGGHAGRLSRFVSPLVEAGFSAVAFDAPGHGASPARLCSLQDFIRAGAAVLLAPPANPEELAGKFANICRMSGPVRDSMKVRLAARHGVAWENLRLFEPAPR